MEQVEILKSSKDDSKYFQELLQMLPEWFGIDAAIINFVEATKKYNTYKALSKGRTVGFVTIKPINEYTNEILVMAVSPELHRKGIGRRLMRKAIEVTQKNGKKLLEVKTLGLSKQDEYYVSTYQFYRNMGFIPVEELTGVWPNDPCLIMVKPIGG